MLARLRPEWQDVPPSSSHFSNRSTISPRPQGITWERSRNDVEGPDLPALLFVIGPVRIYVANLLCMLIIRITCFWSL